jgi:hypothetical protein
LTHAIDAPILGATASVESYPAVGVWSDVFHCVEQGHARVSTTQRSQLNLEPRYHGLLLLLTRGFLLILFTFVCH